MGHIRNKQRRAIALRKRRRRLKLSLKARPRTRRGGWYLVKTHGGIWRRIYASPSGAISDYPYNIRWTEHRREVC